MRIKTKIFSIVLLVILITGVTSIAISSFVSKNMLKNEIYNHLENVVHSRGRNIDMLLIDYQNIVKILATENILIEKKSTDYHNILTHKIKEIIKIDEDISRISIWDTKEKVLASSHHKLISHKEFFKYGKEDIYIKDIYISNLTGQHIISISAPILHHGIFSGLVIVDIDIKETLYKITRDNTGLGETGEIYLINQAGYMITPAFSDDTSLKIKVNAPNAVRYFSLSNKKNAYVNYRGQTVIGASDIIQELNWCLVAEIEEKEVFAPVDNLVLIILLFFLMPLSVAILFSLMITDTITNPVLRLHSQYPM